MFHREVSVDELDSMQSGKKYLTVDAGPMSLPILERLGFVRLCEIQEYVLDSTK